jgi:hypothetical protein
MEKHTKTKADIKSILEKYNLKPSKQTKTNNQPTNFEIKPNINQSNVVHISNSNTSKSAPTTPTKSPLIPISPPPILNSIHSGGRCTAPNSSEGAQHLTPKPVGLSVRWAVGEKLLPQINVFNDIGKFAKEKSNSVLSISNVSRFGGKLSRRVISFLPQYNSLRVIGKLPKLVKLFDSQCNI